MREVLRPFCVEDLRGRVSLDPRRVDFAGRFAWWYVPAYFPGLRTFLQGIFAVAGYYPVPQVL